jgi:hypothetical protein
MSAAMNPSAPHHLPVFITAPGETDVFLNGSAVFIVAMILLLGSVYFRLHALPEKLAHGTPNRLQFEIVAVLALLALFTHNHLYWVAALLLALIRIPDYATPLGTIADSLARMAGLRRRTAEPEFDDGSVATSAPATAAPDETSVAPGEPAASPAGSRQAAQ